MRSSTGASVKVIVNADDFGRSTAINRAVGLAHTKGVLTSASLMVAGVAVDEAIQIARQTPTLAVGLHVVTMAGRAVLPHHLIPHIVDDQGCFPSDPLRAGLRYFFVRAAQKELAAEMEAQFERFAATGLPLSHVDGHCHMHMHPTVCDLLLVMAERYGAKGFRLPRDELLPALGYDRRAAGTKMGWAIAYGLLCRRCAGRLGRHRLTATDRVFGLMQTGQMHEDYVVRLLRRLDVNTAEVYFHPSTEQGPENLGPNPTDLATLLSPRVQHVIRERRLQLSTYPALSGV